ncbi:hypothetical protein F5880DRAFT_1520301 [Lentinula raphanica]|nr:hypothetical protein F5880DRAFT_1520301 [Lentinula raphanica]
MECKQTDKVEWLGEGRHNVDCWQPISRNWRRKWPVYQLLVTIWIQGDRTETWQPAEPCLDEGLGICGLHKSAAVVFFNALSSSPSSSLWSSLPASLPYLNPVVILTLVFVESRVGGKEKASSMAGDECARSGEQTGGGRGLLDPRSSGSRYYLQSCSLSVSVGFGVVYHHLQRLGIQAEAAEPRGHTNRCSRNHNRILISSPPSFLILPLSSSLLISSSLSLLLVSSSWRKMCESRMVKQGPTAHKRVQVPEKERRRHFTRRDRINKANIVLAVSDGSKELEDGLNWQRRDEECI